ncbi:TrkH family potassium uptake protein [Nocardiopsis gilva]|uniref:TrkH family potassium uptake protein n=1 Tax=Nocardiopsis gilva TaxID=280236 RepID=UPI000364B225|nr:potassium transporter TrkG [Nocardiopsis gilva]
MYRLRDLARLRRPASLVVLAFATIIAFGTVLLALPQATESGESAGFVTALFTSTSAVCVTGLIVVDTPGYWSTFGEVVILGLIQIGGFGIMSLATVLSLLVTRRVRLRMQITAGTETKSVTLGDVRQLVSGIVRVTLIFESVLWLILTLRLWTSNGDSIGHAAYMGLFHSISAFNNAGFALYSDSLEGFATDPWIMIPVALAVIAGGLGFPVWVELWRHTRHRRENPSWTLHARITLVTTAVLLVVGWVAFLLLEWSNPDTMGRLGVGEKVLTGFFQSVMPRTAGFNSLPFGEMNTQTLFVTDMLMFVGGGSAGTAGGIKVTTFALLAFVLYATIRGEPSVHVGNRRLAAGVAQQAITIVLLAIGLVFSATLILMIITPFTLDEILFEAISAFSTVGLSTGITGHLGTPGELIIIALMFIGRLGPITLASALALRRRVRRFELPEERPIVG